MKKYQAVAYLLSTAMTVSSVAPVFGASSDIVGHWAETTITKWQNDGRIGGYEDGTFQPDKAITRAEFVRLLNTAVSTPEGGNIDFSDVKSGDWFYNDVAKAVGSNIASGFEDNTFRPSETVTRIQAAVFICNALKLTANESGASAFTDAADIPGWAKGAVGAVVSAGFLSGYPDGSFGANKDMTRAEAVSTLDRVLGNGTSQNIPQSEIDNTDKQEQDDNKTANAGTMVWKGGGSGSSSSKSSGSSSSDSEYKNIVIRSQAQADNYSGKTLTGTTEIYITDKGIDLTNIKFDGNVDIYAQSNVAVGAAYDDGTVTTALGLGDIEVIFEGSTGVTGRIRVISNDYVNTQVVIRTHVPKKISKFIAEVAAKIAGFEVETVEAKAPIVVSEGTSVDKIDAQTGSSVAVEESAAVENIVASGEVEDITLNGDSSTSVTVSNGASVESIAVNDTAKADVKVESGASVDKITLNDTAKADIEVKENAAVDTIDSNSSAEGTTISGIGDISNITANNPGTIDKTEEVETPITPTKLDTPTEPTKPTTPTTKKFTISAADTKIPTINGTTPGVTIITVSNLPEGESITWTSSDDAVATVSGLSGDDTRAIVTAKKVGTVTITATTSGGSEATCTITVEEPKTQSLKLSKSNVTLAKGTEVTITATAKDQFGVDVNVTWEVKNGDADYTGEAGKVTVAKTDGENGKVVITNTAADAAATLTVTAKTVDGKEETATVTISTDPAEIDKIVVTPGRDTVISKTDATVTCTAEAQTKDGVTITGKKFTWSIDTDTTGASNSINASNGTVTIANDVAKEGKITVIATCDGKSGKADITVKAIPVASKVEITAPTATEITAGDPAVTFTAKVVDQYNQEMAAEKSKIKWSLEGNQKTGTTINPSTGALTVDVAEPDGKLTITATYDDTTITATKDITVKPAPKEVATVEVAPDTATADLTKGNDVTIEFTATIKDSEGNEISEADRNVTWEVTGGKDSGTKFATASTKTDANGVAKGTLTVSKDETATSLTVKATCDTKNATATVTVKPALPAATATVGDGTKKFQVGKEITLWYPEVLIITITENGPVFVNDEFNGNYDATDWIVNLPKGLRATITQESNDTAASVGIRIYGIPEEEVTESVWKFNKIPGNLIIDNTNQVDVTKEITVTENENAKFVVTAADPDPGA